MSFDGEPPCTADPESFFSDDKEVQAVAERVCASCPFQEPCRELRDQPFPYLADEDSRIEGAEYGTWAGETLAPPLVTTRWAPEIVLTPRQQLREQRLARIRVLLSEGKGQADIARDLEVNISSVAHLINTYLTLEA